MNTDFKSEKCLIMLSSEEQMSTMGGSFGYDAGVFLRILGMSIGGIGNTANAIAEAAYIQYLNSR